MSSIVHRSVPTNVKWFPNCSHAHALFQDRFKDVQVGSRWFTPNFHNPTISDGIPARSISVVLRPKIDGENPGCKGATFGSVNKKLYRFCFLP